MRLALPIIIIGLIFSSCRNSKQLAYFQDLNDSTVVQKVKMHEFEPLRLQEDDQLQIVISSTSPEAAQYFNLSTSTAGQTGSFTTTFSVDPNGMISMPVLGDILVKGMTTQELKAKITQMVRPYLKDAVVSVRLSNFKVFVIGEVGRPVTVPIDGEKFTALEAIGAAGDMTTFAHRYNVKVMHKTDSGMEVAHLNFNTSKIMQSPYYQLKQNDIVYVEPDKIKGFRSETLIIIMPLIFSIISLASSLLYRFG